MRKKNDDFFKNVLGYLIKKYNIEKPRIISYKKVDNAIELLFKDKESKIYSIRYDINNITIQRLGNNYKDLYILEDNDIIISKRIYENKDNIVFEKIYPEDFDYSIVKHDNKTYYNISERDFVKINIDDNLYRMYEYHLINNYLDCSITLKVPIKQYLFENKMSNIILNKGNSLNNIEDLLKCLEFAIEEYTNVFIDICNTKTLEKSNNTIDTFDGFIKTSKKVIEEERIEYNPINYINEDNKIKRRI